MQAIRKKITKVTATPKGRIIFFSILLLIIAAIAGGLMYWSFYKKKIIREQLENAIHQKSKGLYLFKYEDLQLDELAGNLSVKNLTLTFDSMKYVALLGQSDAPPTLLRIKIPEIIVSGVKTPRALLEKEIVGRKVEIRSPVIDIIYTNAGKDSARHAPTKEVYEQILGNLNLIRIDTVLISQAVISTRDLKSGTKKVELVGTDVQLIDVMVDSTASTDDTRLLFSKTVAITSSKLSWSSADKRYNYGMDSLSLTSESRNIRVKRFHIDPLLDEQAFTRSLKLADDRFDFTMNNINIRNIDFYRLFNEEIIADSVVVSSSSFKIYRDLALPHDKKNRVGTYPNQAIASIPVPLHIKTILLQNSFVEYKERNQKTRQSGKVQFFNTNATLSNVTNMKEVGQKNGFMIVDARTRFLNKTALHATWKFYLFHPKGRFDLNGTLGTINARDVNVLAEPMGPAKIEDGVIKSLRFNFAANDYNMSGKVTMIYDNLKVAVMEKDEDTKKLKKKKFLSFAANIIIKNSNPSGKKDNPRVIDVNYQRDTHRSMFHMIWKGLFKGIKESAGINK